MIRAEIKIYKYSHTEFLISNDIRDLYDKLEATYGSPYEGEGNLMKAISKVVILDEEEKRIDNNQP